jgi:hypothetical protein
VIAHAAMMVLRDVEFRVSEAGRQRVLREKRKNVHAFVVGELAAFRDIRKWSSRRTWLVRYNPYRGPCFVLKDNDVPVTHAHEAMLIATLEAGALAPTPALTVAGPSNQPTKKA